MKQITESEALALLRAIDTRDPETAHANMDDIIQAYLPMSIRIECEKVKARLSARGGLTHE